MAGRNYKNAITKIRALGHAKKKNNDEIKKDIEDYLVRCQAINDINKDIAQNNKLNPHEKQFNSAINHKTFYSDFNELDNPYAVDYKEHNVNENEKNMKKVVKLTESELHNIIKESVTKILNEEGLLSKIKKNYKEKQRLKDREKMKQAGEGDGKSYM